MESVSDYMLLEIFDYLDPASLKNCTEVSKRWDTLISRSGSTIDKLTLKVDKSCKIRDLRDIKRRYSNMALYKITISPQVWSLLMNCQPQLRKLELNAIETTELNFKKILQSMPTLHELKLYYLQFTSRNGGRVAAVKMPMLQKLTVGSNHWRVLQCIDGSTLKKLELLDSYHISSLIVNDWQELEDLAIAEYAYNIGALSFTSLKKLEIRSSYNSVTSGGMKLISAHANTLERLKLNWPGAEEVNYDLTNVVPFNSLSTTSFNDFYDKFLQKYNGLPELVASTAKYYLPQMKFIKISDLNLR